MRKLANKLGLAYQTVANSLSRLKKRGFLKKVENGLYLVNPAVACKTTVDKKKNILIQFVDKAEYEDLIAKVDKEVENVGN